MRISDWSSDVCSSDLGLGKRRLLRVARGEFGPVQRLDRARGGGFGHHRVQPFGRKHHRRVGTGKLDADLVDIGLAPAKGGGQRQRSEEHTSALQSLMRNSYAVLCLKKKKRYKT